MITYTQGVCTCVSVCVYVCPYVCIASLSRETVRVEPSGCEYACVCVCACVCGWSAGGEPVTLPHARTAASRDSRRRPSRDRVSPCLAPAGAWPLREVKCSQQLSLLSGAGLLRPAAFHWPECRPRNSVARLGPIFVLQPVWPDWGGICPNLATHICIRTHTYPYTYT